MTGRRPSRGRRRLISALQFFPRGGSSHVARALAQELPSHGWDVTLVSGSRTDLGAFGDAGRFYAGLDVHPVSFDAALASPDPLDPPPGVVPLHPSYEDRPGAPDRVFAALDEDAYERQVTAWARVLAAAGAADADALHLHHLTPIHEAASRVAPDVPVIGHLHGTELLMLEAIAAGPPPGWTHADAWAQRMRDWARRCERLIVLSPSEIPRADGLLGLDPGRLVVLPNGFDPRVFVRRDVDRAALLARRARRGAARLACGPARGQCALRPRGPRADHRRRRGPDRQPFHRRSSGFRCSSRPSRRLATVPGRPRAS